MRRLDLKTQETDFFPYAIIDLKAIKLSFETSSSKSLKMVKNFWISSLLPTSDILNLSSRIPVMMISDSPPHWQGRDDSAPELIQ